MASRRTLKRVLDSALQSLGEAQAHVEAAKRLHTQSAPRPGDTAGDVAALDQDLAALESDRGSLEREVGRLGQVQRKRAEDYARQAAAAVNRQRGLLDRLAAAAPSAAPGWLGRQWPPEGGPPMLDDVAETPVDGLVRIGSLAAVADHQPAPMLIPFLGRGHLQLDPDGADEPAVGLLRGIVLRVLASARPGDVRLLAADPAHVGGTFADFQALVRAGVQEPTATSVSEFRDLLDWAERHVKDVQDEVKAAGKATLADLRAADPKVTTPYVLLAVASFGSQVTAEDHSRLATLARVGGKYGLHIVCVGFPGHLEHAQQVAVRHDTLLIAALGKEAPVIPDEAPDGGTVAALCRQLARSADAEAWRRRPTLASLVPERTWTESSVDELRTTIGFDGTKPFTVAFNDATPHWLIGGRSGSGKTIFLLDLLYGLAARYSPEELSLYLLDFKEGVSFSEFTPRPSDETWLPHARAVGIESDREYGLAVLRLLSQEMVRRSTLMKRYGVSKLADLRQHQRGPMPRILAVIDEFHVLLLGSDGVAKRSVALLEEIARKGRSYGIHLALASQSISGIPALETKKQSIFGQFPLRVALPGAKNILDFYNDAADALPIGRVVINDQAGITAANSLVSFPNTYEDPEAVKDLRNRLWEARAADNDPPAVFEGFAEQRIEDDPTYGALEPTGRTPAVLVGRTLDVGLSTAALPLEPTPGRHIAVLGTSDDGAGVLHAAALSLAKQHDPGEAVFHIGGYVSAVDEIVADAVERVTALGHTVQRVSSAELPDVVAGLSAIARGDVDEDDLYRYLIVFGADAVSGRLEVKDRTRGRTGLDDLRAILKFGPGRSTHVIGWWRTTRRLITDIGGTSNKEDMAAIIALNVNGNDLMPLFGDTVEWSPRANRALLTDKHVDVRQVIVPFARQGSDALV